MSATMITMAAMIAGSDELLVCFESAADDVLLDEGAPLVPPPAEDPDELGPRVELPDPLLVGLAGASDLDAAPGRISSFEAAFPALQSTDPPPIWVQVLPVTWTAAWG
jgi:hypothetical protein